MAFKTDVVVVGAGNAALCAALAAREAGAEVTVLECAPESARGGNTAYTGGTFRLVYDGVDDLRALVPDLSPAQVETTDFGRYTREEFLQDLAEATEYRCDPDLAEIIVDGSFDTFRWLCEHHAVQFALMFHRQTFTVDGRRRFYGGLAVEAWGGGPEYSAALFRAAERAGADVRYGSRATSLLTKGTSVEGVSVTTAREAYDLEAGGVVLASGGFESNAAWRAQYLGSGWELAKVRGNAYNMGDGIKMALDVGAMPHGHWSHCHAIGQDVRAPLFGGGASFQKHSYEYGIMVNALGQRFVDEGANFHNYTYAKYGKEILRQPGHVAWQVFDRKGAPYLRTDHYRREGVSRITADSLESLVGLLEGVDGDGLRATVEEFNAAVDDSRPFSPTVLDGRRTRGLTIDKTNFAQRVDEPPFEAYPVSPAVTFTFGGVRITTAGEVVDRGQTPIQGLYAAGEMVGGIFYFNYPAGSGLTSGAVIGRLAGTAAAAHAMR